MLKKPVSPAQLAAKRLQQRVGKVEVKKLQALKADRARFIERVSMTQPSEAKKQEAGRLVKKVRDAKSAQFVQQYRTTR